MAKQLDLQMLQAHMEEMSAKYQKDNVSTKEILGRVIESHRTEKYDGVMVTIIDEETGEERRKFYTVGNPEEGDRFVTKEQFDKLIEEGGDLIKKANVTLSFEEDGKTDLRFKGFVNTNAVDLPQNVNSVEGIVGYHFNVIISAFEKEDGSHSIRINKMVHRPDEDRNANIRLAAQHGAAMSL